MAQEEGSAVQRLVPVLVDHDRSSHAERQVLLAVLGLILQGRGHKKGAGSGSDPHASSHQGDGEG